MQIAGKGEIYKTNIIWQLNNMWWHCYWKRVVGCGFIQFSLWPALCPVKSGKGNQAKVTLSFSEQKKNCQILYQHKVVQKQPPAVYRCWTSGTGLLRSSSRFSLSSLRNWPASAGRWFHPWDWPHLSDKKKKNDDRYEKIVGCTFLALNFERKKKVCIF